MVRSLVPYGWLCFKPTGERRRSHTRQFSDCPRIFSRLMSLLVLLVEGQKPPASPCSRDGEKAVGLVPRLFRPLLLSCWVTSRALQRSIAPFGVAFFLLLAGGRGGTILGDAVAFGFRGRGGRWHQQLSCPYFDPRERGPGLVLVVVGGGGAT